MNFTEIVERLKKGEIFCRESWNGKKYIIHQIPQTVPGNIVPKMTSLPDKAKNVLTKEGNGSISYHDQVLIISNSGDKNTASEATYYIPSWEDIFAEDWRAR